MIGLSLKRHKQAFADISRRKIAEMKKLNVRNLFGEISFEVYAVEDFGDVHGDPRVDVEAIGRLLEFDSEAVGNLFDLMMAITARHCGEQLVNCEEMPVTPLPSREFVDDDDEDGEDGGA